MAREAGAPRQSVYAWTGRQHTADTREKITAQVIRALAKEVMVLNEYIAELDKLSAVRFREQELAEVISSMPGIGPLLGAEFLAATAGVMCRYGTADRRQHYHRGLQRVSTLRDHQHPQLRRFYERKRAKVRGAPRLFSRWLGDG
ncbi:hypothetical protein ACFXPY_16890 [Streptomyces sp. NPDC059153]|uniref:hypothetical protein n=1 Tax=Streptomyces sp. NPDC059153 TaxID=3346743 RepID=UPI0036A05EA9